MQESYEIEFELIRQCIKGEQRSCKKLYDKYSPFLYSVCLRYINDREEAKDLLQDAFVLIFKNLGQFSMEKNFKAWMKKITVNCCLGHFRKQNTEVNAVEDSSKYENSFIDLTLLQDLNQSELLHFIQLLSPGRKQVFCAYFIEGYSHKEIAEMMNISEGTSKSQLFDAKRELKNAIEKDFAIAKKMKNKE
ncbi:MAG: RNA polymerase sigma factor [Flavobacteriia bacterium]|nr:RNA polymerase sigma factor [Flavobacteriia bacterium]